MDNPHSGTFAAFFGPVDSNGFISQDLATMAGGSYNLSFWLSDDSGGPDHFEVSWNGMIIFSLDSPGAFGYTQFTFNGLAAPTSPTALQFGFLNVPGFWYLDDVSVEAAGLALVSAASRKHHGNAGTFDIDLPLTGTPGVECRVGNGGTFLQTIVFTFSEAVTSISGTTTTTCGSVNSTTISGSTVTVQLGNVNCDGSDITVTVPGVNGTSGSVDASATMTLRTGADGVVNNKDLMEIRMNVGRGLVTEDNFRDDITVDGKVNHGDTTLEKSKL
jgi:hypothetical protein